MTEVDPIEELFDAITNYTCTSRADVAAAAGWPVWKADRILHRIRRPEVAIEWGFTVPHVPRGTGAHLFQAIAPDDESLSLEEQIHARKGGRSTALAVGHQARNEAHALRMCAHHVDAPVARLLRRTATVLDGAAEMALDVADKLDA